MMHPFILSELVDKLEVLVMKETGQLTESCLWDVVKCPVRLSIARLVSISDLGKNKKLTMEQTEDIYRTEFSAVLKNPIPEHH